MEVRMASLGAVSAFFEIRPDTARIDAGPQPRVVPGVGERLCDRRSLGAAVERAQDFDAQNLAFGGEHARSELGAVALEQSERATRIAASNPFGLTNQRQLGREVVRLGHGLPTEGAGVDGLGGSGVGSRVDGGSGVGAVDAGSIDGLGSVGSSASTSTTSAADSTAGSTAVSGLELANASAPSFKLSNPAPVSPTVVATLAIHWPVTGGPFAAPEPPGPLDEPPGPGPRVLRSPAKTRAWASGGGPYWPRTASRRGVIGARP